MVARLEGVLRQIIIRQLSTHARLDKPHILLEFFATVHAKGERKWANVAKPVVRPNNLFIIVFAIYYIKLRAVIRDPTHIVVEFIQRRKGIVAVLQRRRHLYFDFGHRALAEEGTCTTKKENARTTRKQCVLSTLNKK
jgi:hypothetical protein